MTRNSKMRAAEQAVIDAAMKLVGCERYSLPWAIEYRPLQRAIHDLKALAMELPDQARSSRVHPLTSDQAAAWMGGGRAMRASARIVRHLYDHQERGRTVDELMWNLDMSHQTCSARVNELRNDGWIVDSGHKRKTRAKQDAIVWMLTSRALSCLLGQVNHDE